MPTDERTGIAYDRRGDGEPTLLLHGTGGSRAHWQPVVDRLAPHRDLLLVDLPGHGASSAPAPGARHTPAAYAATLAALLDELGIDAAHLVGNSVGGWTALELAKRGRALSVVALAPAGLWARHDPWRCTATLRSQHVMGRLFAPLTPHVLRNPLGRTLLMRGTVARPRQMPAEAAIDMATTFAQNETFREHLAHTRVERFTGGEAIGPAVPVTVAWGEKERLIPAKARLRDELPAHAQVVELPGCGHAPMWDDPDLVARTILTVGSRGAARTRA